VPPNGQHPDRAPVGERRAAGAAGRRPAPGRRRDLLPDELRERRVEEAAQDAPRRLTCDPLFSIYGPLSTVFLYLEFYLR